MKKPNYIRPGKFAINFKDGILRSNEYNDVYFSTENGLEESRHVFLNGNNLLKRFNTENDFTIAELGFGTGLNFLATWQLFKSSKRKGSILNYISIEGYPLETSLIRKTHSIFPELSFFSKKLCSKLPPLWSGIHRIHFDEDQVCLTLIYGEALEILTNLEFETNVWFFDGFSPSKNKSMWSFELLNEAFRLTKPGGTFATFSASGEVRKNLNKAGFFIKKVKGFSNKKEMTVGQKSGGKFFFEYPQSVIVIGSGIAGSSVAKSLQRRGVNVKIIEKMKSIASGSSGNKAAIQSPRLTTVDTVSGRLSLASYRYARDLSKTLKCSLDDPSIVFGLPEREVIRQRKLLNQDWPYDLIRKINDDDRNKYLNTENHFEGVIHDYGGTINPIKMIKKILNNDIEIIFNKKIEKVSKTSSGWQICCSDQSTFNAEAIVLACAEGLKEIKQTSVFDLQYTQGQVSYINKSLLANIPKANISFSGYITPPINDILTVGATYEKYNRKRYDVSIEAHRENFDKIPKIIREMFFNKKILDDLKGKVSMRVSTYDRMPIMGEIEKNLYVLSGLGSRGMVWGPLLGDALASIILNQPSGLDRNMIKSCDPNRIEKSFLF